MKIFSTLSEMKAEIILFIYHLRKVYNIKCKISNLNLHFFNVYDIINEQNAKFIKNIAGLKPKYCFLR